MHDLLHATPLVVAAERAKVATHGWGAMLLKAQKPGGYWGRADDEGWMTTIHSLTLLTDLGVPPRSRAARHAIRRVRQNLRWWQLDHRAFFDGETEPCLNGRILGAGAYFGVPVSRLLERLIGEQLADGGWNCEAPKSHRSSFHTTICVLEGLLRYEQAHGRTRTVTRARSRGQEYLLERGLLRRKSTGEVIDQRWTRFAYPHSWHYDVLRGLDYLRSAGVRPEPRMAEAIDIVRQRQHQNGLWPLRLHADRRTQDLESEVGRASHWITLKALRVLDWYQRGRRRRARA
ncbi:MAG TPA: hypothetical protein VEY89_00500 [Candidatus Dormibacteraeota bacterium]|nr:hypothetical protein [Candidatus Dormibacteraeota bacterium]